MSRTAMVPAFLKLIPGDDDQRARHFIDLVRTGNDAEAKAQLDSSLPEKKVDDALRQIHALLPKAQPLSIQVVGFNSNESADRRTRGVTYELHFPQSWFVAEVSFKTQYGATAITAFRFTQVSDSLLRMNRFTLAGKTWRHYLMLACCMAALIVSLVALADCFRSRVRRKWLWVIFILAGVTQFNFNWTNGAWNFQPASAVLLSAGCRASGPYSPWILDCGVPLGAIIFLVRRKKLSRPPVQGAAKFPTAA